MFDYLFRRAKVIYATSPLARVVVKKITTSSTYKSLVQNRIKAQIADRTVPLNLIIETSSLCNAACLMCPYRSLKRARKIMDRPTWEKIIDRLKKERLLINKVFFSGMGEPLIDPDLLDRIKQVKDLGYYVKLYTNASWLKPEVSQKLIDLKVNEINISFNGTNKREYESIMKLDYETTLRNIESLLKIKTENHTHQPIIRISSVLLKQNEKNVKNHLTRWSKVVKSVGVSIAHEWGGTISAKTSHHFDKTRVFPCRSLWHTINIDSCGNFVICCRDYESNFVLGNIMTDSFAKIEKSPLLSKFRSLHLGYDQSKLPEMCKRCNFPYQEGVEWFLPRSSD